MIHYCPGPGQRKRLVQPLAAAEGFHAGGSKGFPGQNGVIHRIHQISVQRTEIQDFHVDFLPDWFFIVITGEVCDIPPATGGRTPIWLWDESRG